MADIDVVPKKRSLAWLWILMAIAAVVILWAIMSGGNSTGRVGQLSHPSEFSIEHLHAVLAA